MKFTAADQAAMLAAVGQSAVCNGGTIQIEFTDGQQVEYSDGTVGAAPPTALAMAGDVQILNIVGGTNGSTITIDGKDYRVHAVEPDGSGFVVLTLGAS